MQVGIRGPSGGNDNVLCFNTSGIAGKRVLGVGLWQ